MTSEGTIIDPFTSLKEAFENPRMVDGQTIYLRTGTHYLYENSAISLSNITVQPYQNEVVRIVFKPTANTPAFLSLNGDNIRFRNLEIASEPTNRLSAVRGVHTGVQLGFIAVNAVAPADGVFRNCTLRDLGTCYWYAGSNEGGTLYKDCLLYNWGWPIETGETDGEFSYTQNASNLPVKYYDNCIFGSCFSVGHQMYAEALATNGESRIQHYTFNDCIFVHSYPFVIASGALTDINLINCSMWQNDMILGSTDKTEGSFAVVDCWWISGLTANDDPQFGTFAAHDVQNNRFVTVNGGGRYFYNPATNATWGASEDRIWNNNEYYGTAVASITFPNGQTFAQWKANTGFDAVSTHSESLPASNWVRIYPCELLPRVAHIVIYNWAEDDDVTIDVSSLNLSNGNYRARNAYDPLVDYTDIVYAGGGSMVIPMIGRTNAIPEAYMSALDSIDARFGAFVLERL